MCCAWLFRVPSSMRPTRTCPSALFQSGILAHFNLLLLIEETYGVRFSKEQLAELKSLSQITAALAAMDRRQKRSPQEHKMAKASGLDWPGKVKEGLIQAGIRVGDTVCLHVDALVAAQFPPMSPPSALRS